MIYPNGNGTDLAHVDRDVVDAIRAAIEADAFEFAAQIAAEHGLQGLCLVCLINVPEPGNLPLVDLVCWACWALNLDVMGEAVLRRSNAAYPTEVSLWFKSFW